MPELREDPLWPRAGDWIARGPAATGASAGAADLGILGVPAHRLSITPTGADATPAAIRLALQRYSTWSASSAADVSHLRAIDFSDVDAPDGPEGEVRVAKAAADAFDACKLLVALGGDNSITFALVRAMADASAKSLADCGLVTIDAHHDLRDGTSNGSHLRRLVDAGLRGDHVVQIGIADFSNSAQYASRARDYGIHSVLRGELRGADLDAVVAKAIGLAGAGGGPVYVDIDVDVCDRGEVPGCPSSAPGGLSADDLRRIASACGRHPRVRGLDVTEIDATADASDGRTVRLGALLLLEAAAGLCDRLSV